MSTTIEALQTPQAIMAHLAQVFGKKNVEIFDLNISGIEYIKVKKGFQLEGFSSTELRQISELYNYVVSTDVYGNQHLLVYANSNAELEKILNTNKIN